VAKFKYPVGVAVDGAGNVYVADSFNYAIRKVTPAGAVSTLAGNGIAGSADGTGTAAQFSFLDGVAVDGAGNVYVVDLNSGVRKVTPAGVVSTLASGVRGRGVAVDGGGTVYVAETYNNRVMKITLGGVITTLAGSGTPGFADATGTAAKFSCPEGLAVDGAGNLYVADTFNYRIRKISPTGVVSTLAGSGARGHRDGTGASAQFWEPVGVAVDAAGSVYVGDTDGNRIRKITPTGEVSTLAGTGPGGLVEGPATAAQFDAPSGVAVDALGNLYVADRNNHRIRKVTGNYLQALITNQTAIVTLSAGQTVVFSVTNTGPLSYQWQKDGGDLPGANTNSLTVPVASRAAAGIYSVVVGGAGSSPAVLRVLVPQRLDPVERLGSGGFRLRFGDHDGSPLGESDKGRFIIQWTTISSSPAVTWNDLANTTRTVSGGKVMLDDASASGQASRFYRVIER
jgi:sugar lactone lactonase YvrE